MKWPTLACAQICPSAIKRVRFTCLYCRFRRRVQGKFTNPPYWIGYTYPWSIETWALVNEKNEVIAWKQKTRTLNIDPRGHFTMLRCATILVFDKIMRYMHSMYNRNIPKRFKMGLPFSEFCEFLANYPTW